MMHVLVAENDTLRLLAPDPGPGLPQNVIWIDLCHPTDAEEKALEQFLGLEVPTREEMRKIEASSRLYQENDALYMTADIIVHAETRHPTTVPITFIVTPERILTVRYDTPDSFKIFLAHCEKQLRPVLRASEVLLGLLNTIEQRAADLLEQITPNLDHLNQEIFLHTGPKARQRALRHARRLRPLGEVIRDVGHSHDLVYTIQDSLNSLERLLVFLQANADPWLGEAKRQVEAMARDVQSLSEYDTKLSNKVDFMLNATLGLIGIQQNAIIKIFSVAAVVLMPPTLVASVYGMNFEHMPELTWLLGYPWALMLMLISGILPYLFFKWRGWL